MTNKAILLLIIQGLYRTPMCVSWTILVAAAWGTLWMPDLIFGWNLNFWWISSWWCLLLLPTPAMVIVPFGALNIKCNGLHTYTLPLWAEFMGTPDELPPGDIKIPIVKSIYAEFGAKVCTYYWLAWRNVGQNFLWPCAIPVNDYWHNLSDEYIKEKGIYRNEYVFLGLRLRTGFSVYPDPFKLKSDLGFVAVPHLTLRINKGDK